jgi:hypothetical protein
MDIPYPIKTTSFVAPVMLHEDLPRETATNYRAGPHGQIAKRTVPGMLEYFQHHSSATDHLHNEIAAPFVWSFEKLEAWLTRLRVDQAKSTSLAP